MRTHTGLVTFACLVSIGFAAAGFVVAANAEINDVSELAVKTDRVELPAASPARHFVTIGAAEPAESASILLRYERPQADNFEG